MAETDSARRSFHIRCNDLRAVVFERREPALIAGTNVGVDVDSMGAILDSGIAACRKFTAGLWQRGEDADGKPVWALGPDKQDLILSLLCALMPLLDKLRDITAVAIAKAKRSPNKGSRLSTGSQARNQDRDAEVVKLKKEKPSRTAGQIAALIRQNPEWAKMENGEDFSAGNARTILNRAKRSGQLPKDS